MSKNTILIVEDEAIIAYDLASNVQRSGYEVVGITSTGEEQSSSPASTDRRWY